MASSVAVSQACSAVTTSNRSGMASARADSATDMLRNFMRSKPNSAASFCDASTSGARVSMP